MLTLKPAAHKFLKNDGSREEDLIDLYHGQSHRFRFTQDQLIHPLGGENVQDDSSRKGSMVQGDHPRGADGPRGADRIRGTDRPRGTNQGRGSDRGRGGDQERGSDWGHGTDSPLETSRSRGLGRPRGGGMGGRGGGHAGGQNRGSRTAKYVDANPIESLLIDPLT